MSIISTQIPVEIADAIKAQAEALEVTPAWLVRKIIKSYMHDSHLLKTNNTEKIKASNTQKIQDFKNRSSL